MHQQPWVSCHFAGCSQKDVCPTKSKHLSQEITPEVQRPGPSSEEQPMTSGAYGHGKEDTQISSKGPPLPDACSVSLVLDPTKTFQTLDEWLLEAKKLLDINEAEWKALLKENGKCLSDEQQEFYRCNRLYFIQNMDTKFMYVVDCLLHDGILTKVQHRDLCHEPRLPSVRAGDLLSRLSCLHQAAYFSFARAYASTLPGKLYGKLYGE